MSNSNVLTIRPARIEDHDAVWAILKPVFRAGDTYTIDPAITREDALGYWCGPTHRTWVAARGTAVLGTYYIRPNQAGGGAHVCNCGYITSPEARGQGVARAMLEHSLDLAPQLGFRAMQYNFVVATNARAIAIWERYGFDIVGRLPNAFRHPTQGFTDALVMYKTLT